MRKSKNVSTVRKDKTSYGREYLVVGQFKPRLTAVREYLPQHDAVTPDIRVDSERSVQQALRWHPAHRQYTAISDLCYSILKFIYMNAGILLLLLVVVVFFIPSYVVQGGILSLLWLIVIHSVLLRISQPRLYRSARNFARQFGHTTDRSSPILGG